jgi:hypothetical protein
MNSFDKDEWLNRMQTLMDLPFEDLNHKFSNLYDYYFSTEVYYNKLMDIYQTVLKRNEKMNAA